MSAEYIDAAGILSGDWEAPVPTRGGRRADGLHLLYPGAVNGLVGDPETGKTLIATACAADELFQGGSVLWVDIDHNGPAATLTRFRRFGVSVDVLCDRSRFRLAIPEDAPAMLALIEDAPTWQPTVAVVDSLGELLPMFAASSNSADEFTAVNQRTLVRLARMGAAVLGLDHMSKGGESRQYGAGGTVAKKRSIGGAYFRVVSDGGFQLGRGGTAELSLIKDRHGALRRATGGGREPRAAVFNLSEREGAQHWTFDVPAASAPVLAGPSDVELLLAMEPVPTSVRAVREALRCSKDRAEAAARAIKAALTVPSVPGTSLDSPGVSVPTSLSPLGEGRGTPQRDGTTERVTISTDSEAMSS